LLDFYLNLSFPSLASTTTLHFCSSWTACRYERPISSAVHDRI